MTIIPRISGQPMTLEQLIRREYESMVNHGISPKLAEEWLRLAVNQCSHNAKTMRLQQQQQSQNSIQNSWLGMFQTRKGNDASR